jgi:simple sugar transport system ATP-binding protein
MTGAAVLELEGITKTFGGVTALDGVSISAHAGEIVAIVGDNGAGKSTLMKVIAGVHRPDAGSMRLDGADVSFSGPSEARGHGIEVVYQDLALADHQEVFMNMFLGRELSRGPLRLLDKRAMRAQTQHILDELDIRIPSARASVRDLSGGQRQGIAIGRATHWATHVVLMDEPTAALGVQETARVEQLVAGLRERGLAVVIVSHNLDQVFRLADEVYVLRRGRLAGRRETKAVSPEDVVALITGARQSEDGHPERRSGA